MAETDYAQYENNSDKLYAYMQNIVNGAETETTPEQLLGEDYGISENGYQSTVERHADQQEKQSESEVYILNSYGADSLEAYTGSQINQMRREVALYDASQNYEEAFGNNGSFDDSDVRHSTFYENDISALTGGTYADFDFSQSADTQFSEALEKGVKNAGIGQALAGTEAEQNTRFEADGNSPILTKGEHSIVTDGQEISVYNSLSVGASNETTKKDWSEEDISHMKSLIAEADAIDGIGNYQDNLEKLQGNYMQYSASHLAQRTDSTVDAIEETNRDKEAMEEATTQEESQGLIGGAISGIGSFVGGIGTTIGAAIGGITDYVKQMFSGSDKEEDSSVHYEGELGTFDYDPTQWTLEQKQNYTDDMMTQSDMVLKYIGEETDGSKIEIPDGLNSLDYSFAGTNITSVPEIPNSVGSAVNTFANTELSDVALAFPVDSELQTGDSNEYFGTESIANEHETYNVSGDTDENNVQNTDEISQQAEGQKVYVINGHNRDSDIPEIYTEQQIDNMRREVANADTWKDLVDTYKDYETIDDISVAMEANDNMATFNTRYYALTDGTYAEANGRLLAGMEMTSGQAHGTNAANYEIMQDNSDDDAASMYEQGEHIVTFDNGESWNEYDNQLNVGSKTEGFDEQRYHRSESEINHMKEILAEVDEIDGKGNYEDNLQALQDGSYVEKAQQVASVKGEELEPEKDEEALAEENGYVSADSMARMLRDIMFSSAWIKNYYSHDYTTAGQALQDTYDSTFGETSFDSDDDEIYKNIENDYDTSEHGTSLMGASTLDDASTTSNKSNRSLRDVQDIADRVDETEEESWSYGIE